MSTYDTIMAQQLKQRMDRASQAPPLNAPSLYPTQQNPLTTPPQLNVQQAATGGVQHQPKPQSQPAQQQPQMSYADMFVQLNPYRQPTPEELEAERKRYKRNAVFAAISDGLSALSNLYFTTKGAPNAYTGGSTLTGKMYERQKQLMQERQANQEKWLNGYLRAMEMDRNTANQERNWQHQLQREALTDQRYDEEKKRQAKIDELNAELKRHQITEQEYKNQVAKINAEYAPLLNQSKVNSYNALANKRNSEIKDGGGGSSKPKTVSITGGVVSLPSDLSLNDLYMLAAKRIGIPISVTTGIGRDKKESYLPYSTIEKKLKESVAGENAIKEVALERGGSFESRSTQGTNPYGDYRFERISTSPAPNGGTSWDQYVK